MVTAVAASLIFAGAGLVLSGSALMMRDWSYYYDTIGILLLIGFSCWGAASIFSFIGSFRKGNDPKDRYIWINMASSVMFLLASANLIVGAAFWLTGNDDLRYTGRILWIVGGGLTLATFFTRVLGAFWDSTDLYRHETYLPAESAPLRAQEGAVIDFKPTGNHKAIIWANNVASSLYLVAASLFWIGTITMFMIYPYLATDYGMEDLTGALWCASSGLMIFGALMHIIARK
jgi:hypothetical protein